MVQNQDLFSPGVSHASIEYENFWDWFVQVRTIEHHLKYQPTYLISQFAFLLGGLLTLTHALIKRQRFIYLWLGVLLHGIVVEMMSYYVPDIDNFWHSQTPIIFLGQRLPLHIILLYPCFLYQASVAVGKLKLPLWAEPFAVGLVTVLIDIPYDIVSVNYLHWTWHDTDPNIQDRHYWVPWNSYYFHACFAASFTFWFHFLRRRICKSDNEEAKWQATNFWKELICTVLAAFLGTPGGILMFIPIYHPLHDIYKLHSEVTFFVIFVLFLLIIWTGDRNTQKNSKNKKPSTHWSTFLLLTHLVVHYTSFLLIPIFFKSEDEVAIGLKEPIGPCNEYSPVQTAFGMVLKKRKYLCATDYDEKYFDFHCVPGGQVPPHGSEWYTACGVPLENSVELIVVVALICVTAATVFWNLHFNSFGDEKTKQKTKKQ